MSDSLSAWAPLAWAQLWQVTAVALVALLVTRAFCRYRPHLAYALLLVVLVKCLTPPIWSSPLGVFAWTWNMPSGSVPAVEFPTVGSALHDPVERPPTVIPVPAADVGTASVPQANPLPEQEPLGSAASLLLAWACGATAFGAFVTGAWIRHLGAIRKTSAPATKQLAAIFQQLAGTVGLKRRVRLLISTARYGPSCFGLVFPFVVLPDRLVERAGDDEQCSGPHSNIEPILAHELTHIRRGDNVVALFQVIAWVVWWFHPLVWLVSRQLSREREKCCDEEVLARTAFAPERYAQGMLDVLKLRRSLAPAFLSSGLRPVDITKERLEAIMSRRSRWYGRTPWFCWLVLILGAMFVAPAQPQDRRPADLANSTRQNEASGEGVKESDEARILHEKWNHLGSADLPGNAVLFEVIIRRHLNGLMRAAHGYHEEHGTLPPAAVPNPALPPDKRLSGLVLLLPYFGEESWFETGRKSFEHDEIVRAKAIYDSIDRTKAWDDPANIKAAKTLVPAFLAPGSGPFRDEHGYAVSHFALLRGFDGKDSGIFTDTPIKLSDVTDGTSSTLAIGQINSHLGPWIAAGPSTSRHMYQPTKGNTPSFGSPFKGASFFALCDSSTHLLDLERTPRKVLEEICTRSGGEPPPPGGTLRLFSTGYRTVSEWKESQQPGKDDKKKDDSAAAEPRKWGTLRGRFFYVGKRPEPKPLREVPLVDQSLLVDDKGGIANIVVYLRTADARIHPRLQRQLNDLVMLEEKKGQLTPHILTLWAPRQTLHVTNAGPTATNLSFNSPKNPPFNVMLPPGEIHQYSPARGDSLPHLVSCNIKPRTRAYLLVRENPYVAISRPDGTFRIEHLPAGPLEFQVWHERSGPLQVRNWDKGRFKVSVVEGDNDLGTIDVPARLLDED